MSRHIKLLCMAVIHILMAGMFVDNVRAECLACSQLRSVQVYMKDGGKHTGYLHWNDAWFENKSPFPEALIDQKALERAGLSKDRPLTLYTQVFPIVTPVKSFVTTESYTLKIDLPKIARINPIPMKYDGHDGTSLNIVSNAALKLLTTEKPNAIVFIEDTGVSEEYVISFNSEIDEEKLKKIFEEEKNPQKLEQMGIVVMSFAYD